MRWRTASLGAMAVLSTVMAGCGLRPIEEVQSPSAADELEPATLAFSDDPDAAEPAAESTSQPLPGEPGGRAADTALLEISEPGAWTLSTSDARVGVHSAPDYIYTRMGVLQPGASVITTGRRVATNSVDWMEIRWADSTAWVVESPFVPLG